ncbi:BON domain-containing protein [Phenylobacterium sp. J367]|uniref:BON domain-containing protein n=1 Tax=Phenylobacterium sp. J367 TaxID=2898435 RepID=UPI0021519DCD|nr:BON domain-containing protein [Phenylobacterium sp. J367]MCR5879280.1 BON domain-containing protein [Phenylobacterium sp. J367]
MRINTEVHVEEQPFLRREIGKEANMDDKTVKKLVEQELGWEPSIDASNVAVTVEHGIVHLLGHVPTYLQKVSAENVVKRLKGVRGYVEDLQIRPQQQAFTDRAIAERVANLIDWDVTIPKGAIKVKVEGGFVSLTGEVDWHHQRMAAEHNIRRLAGVLGLSNAVTVKSRPAAGDIKKRIEDALQRQAEVEAGEIRVSVDGDRVRLDGKVRAWFEREVIERAAWAAPGVKVVEDHVSVGS